MTTARNFADVVARVSDRLPKDDPDRLTLEELRGLLASKGLTTGGAADLLGVSSKNTVKKLLEDGRILGAIRTSGGHWRLPPDAVLKYRADQLRARAHGSLRPPRTSSKRETVAG